MTTNDASSAAVPGQATPVARACPPDPSAPNRAQIHAMQALAHFVGLHPTLALLDFTITRSGAIVSRVADDFTFHEAAEIIGEYGGALATACSASFRTYRLQNGSWEWTELRAQLPSEPARFDAPTVPITIVGRRWAMQNPYASAGVDPLPAQAVRGAGY